MKPALAVTALATLLLPVLCFAAEPAATSPVGDAPAAADNAAELAKKLSNPIAAFVYEVPHKA